LPLLAELSLVSGTIWYTVTMCHYYYVWMSISPKSF
jgi:hypothetical protein